MGKKYAYIDFEYNNSSERLVSTVCCVFQLSDTDKTERWWVHNTPHLKQNLAVRLNALNRSGYIFVSFAVTAEARAFIDLGLEPKDFKWVDLYVEWRQLRNCCHAFQYGTYFMRGIKMHSVPPNFRHPEVNVGRNNMPVGNGLADCVGHLLKVNIDKELKTVMRDLIISNPPQFNFEEQRDILDYCESDIVYLPEIHSTMYMELKSRVILPGDMRLLDAQIKRGEFSVQVAHMETEGIPIDMEAITNLRNNVELAKDKLISDLVENHYPFFQKKFKSKKDTIGKWTDTYLVFHEFIENHKLIVASKWKKTDSGRYCQDDEYLKAHEGIPELKVYREVRKSLGQLKWLRVPEKPSEDLFNSIGSDGRLRTFFGIYGTQTARNAPQAKRFIFAMSAWLRCLIKPPKGYVITEIDYASQEFAIAALLSGDKNMIEAYRSGDPYLFFAKQAGAVPNDGTKDEYQKERDLFKATTLGLQYGMGATSLATKLTSDVGRLISIPEATRLINLHKAVYPKYWRWLKVVEIQYTRNKHLMLPCGWALLGDNPQILSVRNFPVQGGGSSIIREAVKQCGRYGVTVMATLHDAIYLMSKKSAVESDIALAKTAMTDAFNAILDNQTDLKIRLDVSSHHSEETWVSEKGKKQYEILKEYLKPTAGSPTSHLPEAPIIERVKIKNKRKLNVTQR